MRVFNLAEELEKERKKNKELEKEINRLTAESTHYESKYYNEAKKVDKAIEHIETDLYPNGSYCVNGSDLPYDTIETLLNILKGDNK